MKQHIDKIRTLQRHNPRMSIRIQQRAEVPNILKHVSVLRGASLFHPMNRNQSVGSLVELQKQYGNRLIQRVVAHSAIQAMLRIDQLGERYEQKADRVANIVTWLPEPKTQLRPEEENIDTTKEIEQDQAEEEFVEGSIQGKQTGSSMLRVNPGLEALIRSFNGRGQPLSRSDRAFFESRFGYGFGQVRVHTNTKAAEAAKLLNAKAFTKGRHIVFGTGKYLPTTREGRRLLAHELVHVAQQGPGKGRLSGKPKLSINEVTRQAADKASLIQRQTGKSLNPRILAEAKKRYEDPIINKSYRANIPWVFCPDGTHQRAYSKAKFLADKKTGTTQKEKRWARRNRSILLGRKNGIPELGPNLGKFPDKEYVTWFRTRKPLYACHLFVYHVLYKANIKGGIPQLTLAKLGRRRPPSSPSIYSGGGQTRKYLERVTRVSDVEPGDIFAYARKVWQGQRQVWKGHSGIVFSVNRRKRKFAGLEAGERNRGIYKKRHSIWGWRFFRFK